MTVREVVGDLFTYPADAVVIAVNWRTKRNGEAVMGAGVARSAAERWPWLPRRLGQLIDAYPDEPGTLSWAAGGYSYVVTLPTKRDWRHPADLDLIERGLQQLVTECGGHNWQTIALPRLGCGLGGLSWDDVRPILERYLDDRFVVVHRGDR